ncbi:pleckstrin homology domain-containing family G member 6-like [Heterodontus francisci]|uniref:pleckstrin homology domain-containing family G member 6-like n=1 Tax=Heterodontus francisci TaxID=7792 RepID=UPI00355AE443
MSRFAGRTWNVPQVTVLHEDLEVSDTEVLDPGPLGLVAARIQLFDSRDRASYGSSPFLPQYLAEGVSTKNKGSRTLGYQAGGKKTKKNIPEYATLSRYQSSSGGLQDLVTPPDNNRGRSATRFSAIFNSAQISKESETVQELYRKLTSFSVYGLPRLPDSLRNDWEIREGEESRITLQSTWRDFVQDHEKMSRKQSHQQEAIWEMLQTEISYLRKLKIITDLFIAGLLNLQASGLLQEVDPQRLFGNIHEIIRVHRGVWQEVMMPVLDEARASGKPLDPLLLCHGFRTFPERFHSYINYCLSEARSLQYAHITQQNNKLFGMYVKWAETHKLSNRMRLNDMLVKPHQRLTKYPLLFKAILKKTEDPVSSETILNTISTIEYFIRSIDSQMLFREEQQKLASIASRICQYDVVESSSEEIEKNVKEFSNLDLTLPMVGIGPDCVRVLLLEGSLKMKEGKDSKTEVHCLLFTDLFLITKPLKKGSRAKVIRQPLMLDKIVSRELKDPGTFLLMYVNEMHCVVAAYTFQATSSSVCKEWMDCLSSAQKQLELVRSQEVLISLEEFQQLQEESEGRSKTARSLPTPTSRDPSEGRNSQSDGPSQIPQLVVTKLDNLGLWSETETEPESQEMEGGRCSPPSPLLGLPGHSRSRSPGKVGAQRAIQRRLRRENGPLRHQPAEGPEIQLQAAERAQAEPAEGPEIQLQAAERAQAEPAEGPEIQAQAEPGEGPEILAQAQPAEGAEIQAQAQPAEGPEIQAQAQPAEGPEIQAQAPGRDQAQPEQDSDSPDWAWPELEMGERPNSPGICSVMETLRRAKAMEGRQPAHASEVEEAAEIEKETATTSQPRILTLAELQRIRSPLHLNSTLTTSEV